MRIAMLALALVVCALPAVAQTAHVAVTVAGIRDVPLYNAACVPTVPQIGGYPVPGFPTLGASGGLAFDHRTNLLYLSGGFSIEIFPHPLYTPTVPFPAGPVPVPPMPCPVSTTGVMGPITGMCMGTTPTIITPTVPPAGVLYVTDGACIAGLSAFPPYAMVVPPWPVAAGGGLVAPLTGLDFDSFTGNIIGCDAGGVTYTIIPGGGFAAPPIPPAVPPIGPIVGNIVDENNGRTYITDGLFVYSIFPAPFPPIPVGPGGGPIGLPAYGATYVADPVLLPGACSCSALTSPKITTNTTMAGGTGIPLRIELSGANPNSFAFLGIDVVCAPAFTFGTSCSWHLPVPPAILAGPIPTSAAGTASFPVGPLPPLAALAGPIFYAQWVVACPTTTVGAEVTDAMHMALSAL